MKTHKTFNLVLAFLFAFSFLGVPVPVSAQAAQANPTITACTLPPWISGDGWSAGAQVIISIDIQNTSQSPDFVTTQTADENGRFQYWSEYRFHSGDTITLTDGITTKSLVVSPVQFTSIDLVNNLISGTTSPNRLLWVFGNNFMIETWSDAQGNWSADFIGLTELKLNNTNGVKVFDDDGDVTHVSAPNPYIEAPSDGQWLRARDWPLDTTTILTIDRPSTSASPDYTTSLVVGPASWDSDITAAEFNLSGIYPFQIGDVITMSGWGITKTLTITNVIVASIDASTGEISGMAEPGAEIEVDIWNQNAPYRRSAADENGHWTVDFSMPWSDQGIFELTPNLDGGAFLFDGDGDFTFDSWTTYPPLMNAHVGDGFLNTWNWPSGALLTMTINGPNVNYSAQDSVEFTDWAGGRAMGHFELPHTLNLEAGDVITITDGIVVKSYAIAPIQVTNVDADADTVEGTATPFSNLEVHTDTTITGGGCCAGRWVTADASGNWIADFHDPLAAPPGSKYPTADLVPGSPGQAIEYDDEGNETWVNWDVPNPRIFALLGDQRVHAWGWFAGTPLTLTIDNPATPESPDYTGTQVATAFEDWDHGADWGITLDVQPGYRITVSGGGMTKELVVAHLTVTSVDMDADTVSGTGDPGYEIHVGLLCDDTSCTRRNVYVDDSGNWFADFSVPGHDDDETVFDIRPGSGTGVYQIDEDNDATNVGWDLPYPPSFQVRANWDLVEGGEWTLGDTVTIEVNDPLTPDDIDYSGIATVGVADWDPNQTWFSVTTENYDLKAGDTVTVKDENITKQLLVTDFRITNVDLDTDRVYGKADPGQYVNIWTCWHDNPCVNRDETADANGDWFTDFSVPGEQDWEQETADLRAESWIDSSVRDEDGDQVMSGWYVNDNSDPIANAGPDRIVYAGESFTLDASASSDPEAGALTYAWDLDNDGQYDDASSVSVTTSFYQPGNHVVALQVTDEGGSSDTDTVTVVVLAWTIKGFYQPVDMNGVYNTVKGGSTVPLKFEIFAGPTELTDIANVKSLTYAETMCNANVVTDEVELVATGGTSLRYDAASGQFIYNWKTPKAAGRCYRVTLTLMDDSSLVAYFKLK